jgi:adenosylcobinamide-phosphate guanylyltransferase
MCGGRGTRLDSDVEKPLFEVCGVPMVDRVAAALDGSRVETVYPVVSPHAPATREHLGRPCIETPGEGYVADLQAALADDRIERPVLTAAADLALLDAAVVDTVLDAHDEGSLTVVVPVERKRELGVSVDTTFDYAGRAVTPAGLNVVGPQEADVTYVTEDPRLAVNVNRPADARVAEARCD